MMVTIRSSSSEVSSPALEIISPWPSRNTEPFIPLVEIDIGLLANQVAVSAANTLYLCQCVHDFLLSLNVCIEQTENLFHC